MSRKVKAGLECSRGYFLASFFLRGLIPSKLLAEKTGNLLKLVIPVGLGLRICFAFGDYSILLFRCATICPPLDATHSLNHSSCQGAISYITLMSSSLRITTVGTMCNAPFNLLVRVLPGWPLPPRFRGLLLLRTRFRDI